MIDRANTSHLELDVTNFGPIIQAQIDLRPLTVFVGPSNTGKSYLAILIYALHRAFGGAYAPRSYFHRYAISQLVEQHNALTEMASALSDAVGPLVKSWHEVGAAQALPCDQIVLPPILADFYRQVYDNEAIALSRQINRCFGIDDANALIRKGQRESRILIRRRLVGRTDPIEQALSLARDGVDFRSTVPSDSPIPFSIPVGDSTTGGVLFGRAIRARTLMWNEPTGVLTSDGKATLELIDLVSSLSAVILSSLIQPLHFPAYYLPADRTGVMHAHSVVVGALIASAPAAGLRHTMSTPVLSGVLADFIEQLVAINRIHRPRPKLRKNLSNNIENAILDGSIRVDQSPLINYPLFAYRPRGWKRDVPLANASSMVSELAPVVLYLRHLIGPDDVLVIEEPESHLHPEMQVEFTRQIADIVKAGVRVIVTTHSEWVLDELANIVRRSQVPEAERGDGERRKRTLRSDQVGAWIFKPKRRPRGSVVEEIPLSNVGQYPAGYDDVAHALHNDWAEIEDRVGTGS